MVERAPLRLAVFHILIPLFQLLLKFFLGLFISTFRLGWLLDLFLVQLLALQYVVNKLTLQVEVLEILVLVVLVELLGGVALGKGDVLAHLADVLHLAELVVEEDG